MNLLRSLSRLCVLSAAALMLAGPARAEYPENRIKLVVPFPAGGSVDVVARLFAEAAGEPFKGRIVVMNKVGASGVLGEADVARSNPDGYTILFDAVTIAVNAALYKKPVYDPDELQPVAMLLSLPFVVVTSSDGPTRTLAEAIDLAKKSPQGVTTAYAGASTMLAAQLYRLASKSNLHMVAYAGGPAAALSIMKNETQLYVSDLPSVSPHIRSGKLRGLAVSTTERAKQHPEIPTAAEAGLPAYRAESWFGVFARKGTPPDVLNKLNAEINKFLQKPEIIARLEGLGGRPRPMSVKEFDTYYAEQRKQWSDVIKQAEIPLQ